MPFIVMTPMIVRSLPSPDRNWRANARLPFFARPRRRAESLRVSQCEDKGSSAPRSRRFYRSVSVRPGR